MTRVLKKIIASSWEFVEFGSGFGSSGRVNF